jgi:oligopeptide/dipeptide ABC transporter ATP-binding protein
MTAQPPLVESPLARPLLEVNDLVTSFRTDAGAVRAVDQVSFSVEKGRTLAVVGESGCGKSVTALSVMRLVPTANGSIDSGEIRFDGEDLLGLSEREMRGIRGNQISMIFQEPMTALNPVFTVGQQIMEIFKTHRGYGRSQAREAAIAMLAEVKIPNPEQRVDEYPFQLSGGMLQRVMIAMALACEPSLLIADEPTTALDVTIQAQILSLMQNLQKQHSTAIMLITHDLGVVAEGADSVVIMYAGKVAERADVYSVFENAKHPYTQGLLRSIPGLEENRARGLATIEGSVPSLENLPQGCRFHPRCPHAQQLCRTDVPQLERVSDGHDVACHLTSGRLGS